MATAEEAATYTAEQGVTASTKVFAVRLSRSSFQSALLQLQQQEVANKETGTASSRTI